MYSTFHVLNFIVLTLVGVEPLLAVEVIGSEALESAKIPKVSACPFGPLSIFWNSSRTQEPIVETPMNYQRNGQSGRFMLVAQFTNNSWGTFMDRAKMLLPGQQNLSKSEVHGPRGQLILRLKEADNILGDKFHRFVTNDYLRRLIYPFGNILKIGNMFNQFMNRRGKISVEVSLQEAVENLFQKDGEYSHSLEERMRSEFLLQCP